MFDPIAVQAPSESKRRTRERMTGRVLLAEDDAEMRLLLAAALRNDGYEVIEAADGKELIDHISQSLAGHCRIDLIVTDVRMPRLTGTQVMRFVMSAGLDLPVIVITAFGDHATRIEAFLNGAAAVLDKPFDIADLMDEIRRLRTPPDEP